MPTQLVPVTGQTTTAPNKLAIAAAFGSAGVALADSTDSTSVEVINDNTSSPIEYQVGAGIWNTLLPFQSAQLEISLASTTLQLRRGYNATSGSATINVTSKPTSALRAGDDDVPSSAAAASSYPAGGPSAIHKMIIGALQTGRTATVVLQGDSTGVNLTKDDTTPIRWFLGAFKRLLPYIPGVHVMYRAWVGDAGAGTQHYNAWQVLQQGTLGQRYMLFTGSTGAGNRTRFQAPAQVGDFTGDIDFRILVAPDDWTPSSIQCLLARYSGVGSRGWNFRLLTNGDLTVTIHQIPGTETSTVLTGTAANIAGVDGVAQWLRATAVLSTGVITLYKSPATDGVVTWTQVATTTIGAMTVANPSGVNYEIGGRGNNTEVMTGKVYDVELRNGIDGPIMNYLGVDNWGTSNACTEGGSPTLYLWNGSLAGQNMGYFSDATRHPKMIPPATPALYILNDSHNDTSSLGAAWFTTLDSWLTLMRARMPSAGIGVVVQNPEAPFGTNPSPYIPNQRTQQAGAWAIRNALTPINLGAALSKVDPTLVSVISAVDGVHPVQAGYDAEAAALAASFIGAI